MIENNKWLKDIFTKVEILHEKIGEDVEPHKTKKNSNTSSFVEKAIKVHGDKYDYSKVIYKKAIEKVEIICKQHGSFFQQPNNHLTGYGCKQCGRENMCQIRMTKVEDFVVKASKKHNNKYDYSLVDIKKNNTDIVDIICPSHGSFPQQVANHLWGKGCPKCKNEVSRQNNIENPKGWGWERWKEFALESGYFDSFKVYIVKCWDEEEIFFKIGRTFRKTKRRFDSKRMMPYNYEIFKEIDFGLDAEKVCNLENMLKEQHKCYSYLPKKEFTGMHECFSKILLDEL